ncbi:glycosyltransferase family 4 protein [Synechococcus sp. EJ6-Ellesmere]|uniref:glycosyltransferase family 4 protein n=1 Tax=Synechococcus sp. EJ6-Ellesmere TaxID=2823734 RepID=UPI0020CDCDEF|nr:glycosyltransferase family 4 protein [Synechococcus sp. EJ6-Ellesmere]MCP9826034.1 glycosyltransferase family 4 protein [Synechococcus sp. EJ6-Ellesmere]
MNKTLADQPLRIAITADPELPVPPELYGGIERMIDGLVRELVSRGHSVTLFAHPASKSPCTLVGWPGATSSSFRDTMANMAVLAKGVASGSFDLLHSFSRLAYLGPLLPWPIPKLMTYQRPVTRRTVQLSHALSRGTLKFSAISAWMQAPVADIGRWHVVPNGVDLSIFPFVADPGPEAPLVFLGRLEEIKGPHLAIEAAKRSGLPLVLAGNVATEHQRWVEEHVLAQLDPPHIRYVGPANDIQKAALLGSSRALLMPILWDEPFGIVMAEAMACGTPVLGLNRGAVPEVVEHGVTGFVANSLPELIAQLPGLANLDRAASRRNVERLYSSGAMADGYLRVYQSMLKKSNKF